MARRSWSESRWLAAASVAAASTAAMAVGASAGDGDHSATSRPSAGGEAPASQPATAEPGPWVARLSDPLWAVRNEACERLAAIGEAAYPALKTEFRRTRNYEVRRRIRYLVEQIYFYGATTHRGAFLGISYQQRTSAEIRDIPAGQLWVFVLSVVEGSAAARAGLESGDYITAVNDRPLMIDDSPTFTEWIAQQAPGTPVRLTYRRGGRTQTATAELGRRPIGLATTRDPQQRARERQMLAARSDFSAWWRQEFDPAGELDESTRGEADPDWSLQSPDRLRPDPPPPLR